MWRNRNPRRPDPNALVSSRWWSLPPAGLPSEILGALGSSVTFATTLSIILFIPNGWDPTAGFPAMAGYVPFLMKDVVLLAVSIYLLKQDVARTFLSDTNAEIIWRRRGADDRATLVPTAQRIHELNHEGGDR
jgi:hypothetical protein